MLEPLPHVSVGVGVDSAEEGGGGCMSVFSRHRRICVDGHVCCFVVVVCSC